MYSWSMEHLLAGWKFVKSKSRKVEKSHKSIWEHSERWEKDPKKTHKKGQGPKVRKVCRKRSQSTLSRNHNIRGCSPRVCSMVFTFGRIYMDAKDSDAFEFAWDKIHEAFSAATGKQLAFQAWDPEGWLVTVSGDMEVAPWIGMARSFIGAWMLTSAQLWMSSCPRYCAYAVGMPSSTSFRLSLIIAIILCFQGFTKRVRPHVDEDQWLRFEGLLALKTRTEVETFSDWVFSLNIKQVTGQRKADHAVGEQFEASLASGVMASNRNELSHRTARNAKRHTSAIEKAKNTSAGNNKIKELKAELAILMAEAKTSSSGVCSCKPEEQVKITRYPSLSLFPIAYSPLFVTAKATTSRPKQSKTTTTDEMELDGVEMVSLEVRIEPGIQPDALEPENDVDSDKVPPSEPNLDVDGEGDGEIIYMGDLDVIGPQVVAVPTFTPSPVAPPQSEPEPQLSTRRSSRKRGASKTHEDAPVRKSTNIEAAVAPEPSSSGKRWSVALSYHLPI
ncbi:hypothetical protein B0H14DRAFT_2601169 [Mycena olivaceomarginata]|nr:hypothetical protein B0H14DRAFT_2601169 [Mycena olivaceomarginata]